NRSVLSTQLSVRFRGAKKVPQKSSRRTKKILRASATFSRFIGLIKQNLLEYLGETAAHRLHLYTPQAGNRWAFSLLVFSRFGDRRHTGHSAAPTLLFY